MAAQALSRRSRIALGSVVGAMILSLVAVTAFGGSVAAKGRQHGHGQQASRDSRDQQVHAAARAAGKSNKGKKRKRRDAAPSAGSAPAAGSHTGSSSSGGTQGVAAGLATSLPLTTRTWDVALDCTQDAENGPAVNYQRCNQEFGISDGGANGMDAQIEVIDSGENCSVVRIEIAWQTLDATGAWSSQTWRSRPLKPGHSTGVQDLGDGVRWIRISAIGEMGGCNFGKLTSWSGSVRLMTSSDLSLITVEQ
jgi:hypothetical protein